ncbi:MAG: hypothetical protein ABII89_03310 [Candidatus Omnitrophota bacterium]
MTSRERILKTLQGEKPDRVGISLCEFDGFYESWIHNHPEYEAILKYAEGKTDRFFFWGPKSDKPNIFLGEFPPDTIKTTDWREKNSGKHHSLH